MTDEDRARILELAGQGMTRNEVARESGWSTATVSRVCHAAGLTFDRAAQTAEATRHRVEDQKARMARILEQYLDETEGFLERLHRPQIVWAFGGRENEYNEHVHEIPDPANAALLMRCAGIATDKALAILRTREGADGRVVSALVALVEGLDDGDDTAGEELELEAR